MSQKPITQKCPLLHSIFENVTLLIKILCFSINVKRIIVGKDVDNENLVECLREQEILSQKFCRR